MLSKIIIKGVAQLRVLNLRTHSPDANTVALFPGQLLIGFLFRLCRSNGGILGKVLPNPIHEGRSLRCQIPQCRGAIGCKLGADLMTCPRE
jgi:hypothetical protein